MSSPAPVPKFRLELSKSPEFVDHERVHDDCLERVVNGWHQDCQTPVSFC